MVVEVYSDKLALKVSAKRMWKAAFEDAHSILPKAVPEAVERVEYLGPRNKVGSIYMIHYHKSYAEKTSKEKHLDHLVLFTKEKILEVDPQALFVKLDIIEGGFVGILVKHYKGTFLIQETGPNSSVIHFTFEYEALSEKHKPYVPIAFKDVVPKSFLTIEASRLIMS